MSSDDLTRWSARELAANIRSRRVSPVEVLEAHLAVIARLNPSLNAIVTLATEEARAAARLAETAVMAGEALGPLHGLPVAIKDVTLTAGLRTTFGSPLFRDNVPAVDAEVVTRLRSAGAIVIGKTNTPEFAAGANTTNEVFGATRNPWNTALSPAGSSGGSAVAVASGMTPLAQGTDFGCSIRIPAAFCGIAGMRTTPGLIPNRPMHLPGDAGQVHGPLARDAEDAALLLDAMIGLDPLWPMSAAPPWSSARDAMRARSSLRGLRVAYISDMARIGVDVEIDAVCRKAVIDLSSAGVEVEELSFDASEGIGAYKILRGAWMVGQQLERVEHLDKLGANLAGNVRDGLKLSSLDIARAEHVRGRLVARFATELRRFDFLITPAAPVPPFPVEQNFPDTIGGRRLENYVDWIAPAFLVTMVGLPAGSVPAGKTANGLPVGLQIIGRRFAEPDIFALMKAVEQASAIGWPPLRQVIAPSDTRKDTAEPVSQKL
ncbi:amidase [Bradyrhizobium sp.]|uniref:amidase n=1 Tax=Bradyrhizobium sp. TaxID=376 RepID=UPI0039E5D594